MNIACSHIECDALLEAINQNLKLRHPRCVRYNKMGQVVESNTTSKVVEC